MRRTIRPRVATAAYDGLARRRQSDDARRADAAVTRVARAAAKQRALYERVRRGELPTYDAHARPLSASISDDTATLRPTAPIAGLDLYHAQIWYGIYRRHHERSCASCVVRMHVVWKGGSVALEFPPSDV